MGAMCDVGERAISTRRAWNAFAASRAGACVRDRTSCAESAGSQARYPSKLTCPAKLTDWKDVQHDGSKLSVIAAQLALVNGPGSGLQYSQRRLLFLVKHQIVALPSGFRQ